MKRLMRTARRTRASTTAIALFGCGAALTWVLAACGAARPAVPRSGPDALELPECSAFQDLAVDAREFDDHSPEDLREKLGTLHAYAPAEGVVFVPYDHAPGLQNPREISRLLEAHYPPDLRDRGIGGTARMSFIIDEGGRITSVRIEDSAGHLRIDTAAHAVASRMRFWPATFEGCGLPAWFVIPVTFRIQ